MNESTVYYGTAIEYFKQRFGRRCALATACVTPHAAVEYRLKLISAKHERNRPEIRAGAVVTGILEQPRRLNSMQ